MHVAVSLTEQVPQNHQPIIFNLTGNVLESDQHVYEGNGSNGVLPKPAKLESLISCLEASLHKVLHSGLCSLDTKTKHIHMDDGEIVIATATDMPVPAGLPEMMPDAPPVSAEDPGAPPAKRVRMQEEEQR